MRPLAERLIESERESATWTASRPGSLTPTLRVDPESSLDSGVVRGMVEAHLRTSPPAWDPYSPSGSQRSRQEISTPQRGLSCAGMARPVHFEIHADDPQRAITFYTDVFGWTVNQYADQQYWLVSTGPTDEPGIDGAILPRMGDRPAAGAPVVGMVNTMQVDDLDASLSTAFARGGVLAVDKMVIPGVGTVAYVLDSEANVIGMLQPEA